MFGAQAWKNNVFLILNLGYKGYKDGLQPETLADGNWLVKQNQPVSKIETKSDTNLRSLYESWYRIALISKSVLQWLQWGVTFSQVVWLIGCWLVSASHK